MAYSNDFERTGSKKLAAERISRTYYVETTAGNEESEIDDFVKATAAENPAIEGLPYADFSADEYTEKDGVFEVVINWGVPSSASGGGVTQPLGTSEYRFNFQAPSRHIQFSLETVSSHFRPDVPGAPDFKQMLNVRYEDGESEGLDLTPPPEVFTLAYRDTSDIIDGPYQDVVEALCGRVNDQPFRSKSIGDVMLVRASGGRDQAGIWYIEFGFGYIPTAVNIVVGDITIAEVQGMDYLWVFSTPEPDAGARAIVTTPYAAYVERVHPRADLNLLNLPN